MRSFDGWRSAVVGAIVIMMVCVVARGESSAPIGTEGKGSQGAVAAGSAESVGIGLAILRQGGNAADAATATILALSVTDATDFCFGGEVSILVYDAERKVVEAVSGLGVAPRLATREFFLTHARGKLDAAVPDLDATVSIPGDGLLSAATPAALDACLTLLSRYGTLRFEDVVGPTLQILDRRELAWHPRLARTLRRLVEAERQAPADRLRGLRLVADYFYRGPIAREISAWSAENGGLIRFSDLATHVTRIEDPVSVDYRGYTVLKCGSWTQGPYLLQTLRLLEGFDLKGMGHNTAATIHATIEAMKLALADRDAFYADPLFADVPLTELLSKEYAHLRRPLINLRQASTVQQPGDPRRGQALLADVEARRGLRGETRDTTTCAVADRLGNVIAATPSGWHGVEVGETGVWLGTRLQSFNLWEGHPNCIEPGKRPRITLTPTLVLEGNRPVLAVSVAGGDAQDQTSIQIVLNHIDFGLAPTASLAAFRFGTDHHLGSFRQRPPVLGSLSLSQRAVPSLAEELGRLGHQVQMTRLIGSPIAIAIDPATGVFEAAGDENANRHAGAY